ncbi:Mariner transposase [Oopsacas minuta]|uniref:Mariner transposase n=1 Tax=Oopsacas minuta TaxID=111878 RepID=A0AAV7JBJ7_9METZ|nr:Mariner transposase [Oopsacas minuta]
MATVFWDREGIIHPHWLPEKTTINSDYYVDELKELRQAIKRERPHVSSKTMATIDDLGFECLPYPPYSPVLTPSDCWLFGKMKRPLRAKRFEDFKLLEYEIKHWEKGPLKNSIPLGWKSHQNDGNDV